MGATRVNMINDDVENISINVTDNPSHILCLAIFFSGIVIYLQQVHALEQPRCCEPCVSQRPGWKPTADC